MLGIKENLTIVSAYYNMLWLVMIKQRRQTVNNDGKKGNSIQ